MTKQGLISHIQELVKELQSQLDVSWESTQSNEDFVAILAKISAYNNTLVLLSLLRE